LSGTIDGATLSSGTEGRGPDLIILGQITIDDVVPATPGPWHRQIGGSSLYCLAGARLWLDADRIGLVARLGRDYPFDIESLLQQVQLRHYSLARFDAEHLIEWLIYETDGSRRSVPRNRILLDVAAEGAADMQPYLRKLLEIAPTAAEIPESWLPARALHMCPQVGRRHADNLRWVKDRADWISVDPSPHYSRDRTTVELARFLEGASALLPSTLELRTQLRELSPETLVMQLHQAGIPEVVLKRAEQPLVLAHDNTVEVLPVQSRPVIDPTGAGDSFCGAYAACRLLGHSPLDAARRAAATAALVVGCSGLEAALALERPPDFT
jgi:sugar/nucleoside kinase (ribokinase family)